MGKMMPKEGSEDEDKDDEVVLEHDVDPGVVSHLLIRSSFLEETQRWGHCSGASATQLEAGAGQAERR